MEEHTEFTAMGGEICESVAKIKVVFLQDEATIAWKEDPSENNRIYFWFIAH